MSDQAFSAVQTISCKTKQWNVFRNLHQAFEIQAKSKQSCIQLKSIWFPHLHSGWNHTSTRPKCVGGHALHIVWT